MQNVVNKKIDLNSTPKFERVYNKTNRRNAFFLGIQNLYIRKNKLPPKNELSLGIN